jgi:hypothetical protein
MATAATELLRSLPTPQVSITVGYSTAQKLALVALCLRQAGLERTLSVLEREAAVKGVAYTDLGSCDAASLEKHTALCLAELQAGGAVQAACVLDGAPASGSAEAKREPPPAAPRAAPKPKPAVVANTLDDILGDDVDYSDDDVEDAPADAAAAVEKRREEAAKSPVAVAPPPRKGREAPPPRSEGGARDGRGRADDRAIGIEPPRGAAPRPTWGNNNREAPAPPMSREREREPPRAAPAGARDWQREPAGWERGRAEPRRDNGPPLRGGPPGLPPPPPLPAGRMSGRGPPLLPPPPPPQQHFGGRQAPLPPPPPPGKRARY